MDRWHTLSCTVYSLISEFPLHFGSFRWKLDGATPENVFMHLCGGNEIRQEQKTTPETYQARAYAYVESERARECLC